MTTPGEERKGAGAMSAKHDLDALVEVVQDGRGHRAGLDAFEQRRFETGLRDLLWPGGYPD